MDVIKVEPESDSEMLSEDQLTGMREPVLSPPFALAEVKCEIIVSFHMIIFKFHTVILQLKCTNCMSN
jgi:hypothetical protein